MHFHEGQVVVWQNHIEKTFLERNPLAFCHRNAPMKKAGALPQSINHVGGKGPLFLFLGHHNTDIVDAAKKIRNTVEAARMIGELGDPKIPSKVNTVGCV